MFDESTKVAAFVVVVAAGLFTLVSEHYAPRPTLATSVDSTVLPALPPTALPGGAPAQTKIIETTVALGDGFDAKLMHGYVLEGLVVTRREYRHDATAAISPLDLGIVWGDLSAPGGIDGIAFSTAHRAVWSVPLPDADLPVTWLEQVTNNHLVPATEPVSAALLDVEVGARVRISGFLVEVTGARIKPWRSSTRRNDSSIAGGCEIILVTGVEVLSVGREAA